jgi:hypothetical protein
VIRKPVAIFFACRDISRDRNRNRKMLLREDDSAVFKDWLLPKLETMHVLPSKLLLSSKSLTANSSDADAEVLADYVIALVTANEPEESVRDNCLESLADFLQDSAWCCGSAGGCTRLMVRRYDIVRR